jgi:hypothetical protein
MARQVIERLVSDISGKEIPEGKGWLMLLTPPDRRRNPVRLDISEDEAEQWVAKGTEVKRRGRRPGTTKRANPSGNGRRRKRSAATTTTTKRGAKVAARRKRAAKG